MSGDPLNFWKELKRRRVIKVIAMYTATAFIIMEAADIMFPRLGLPGWTVTLIIVLLIIGFPITLILSWIFDVTPEGIKKTEPDKTMTGTFQPGNKSRRGFKISDGIIGVLFVIVCILLYPKIFRPDKFMEIRDEDGKISVAVLPFENLTGESSYDFWQSGISEYLINDLGSSDELTLMSTQVIQEVLRSINQISTASLTPAIATEAASKINAGSYIIGNFIGSGSNISILLNLVNTESGKLVWSTRVEGDLKSQYLELLGHLADTTRNYLEIKALEKNAGFDHSNAFPKSADAYKYYINGLNAIINLDAQTAQSSLSKALDIDSTFTLAAFYLAWVHNMVSTQSLEEMVFWTNRAHELKYNLPPQYQTWIDLWYAAAHEDTEGIRIACNVMERSDIQSRFFWFDLGSTFAHFLLDDEKAVAAFRKVEELNEQWNDDWNFEVYYSNYANSLLETGKLDEMDRIAEIGFKINPQNLGLVEAMGTKSLIENDTISFKYYKNLVREINKFDVNPEASDANDIGMMYMKIKDYHTAADYFRKAYELDPGRNWSHFWMIRSNLQDQNKAKESLGLIEMELKNHPENALFIWLKGYALHKSGQNENALVLMNEADNILWYHSMLKSDIQMVKQALSRQTQ